MVTEEQLSGWTGPSSPTEQEKQERTERMIREAIDAHHAFDDFTFDVYAKGSYANETNVKADSDVDIVVECQEVFYFDDLDKSMPSPAARLKDYEGDWTPSKLRAEVKAALDAKFPGTVIPGTTAFAVESSTARVDADVVPCFSLRDYLSNGNHRRGTRVFKSTGGFVDNYPKLQLENGRGKDTRTNGDYKRAVRILKRLENVLVDADLSDEVPSYLMECLIYNCSDDSFRASTWRGVMQSCLAQIFNYTIGAEPSTGRWLEVNEAKFLFFEGQKWSREQVHKFASAAWDYMEFE